MQKCLSLSEEITEGKITLKLRFVKATRLARNSKQKESKGMELLGSSQHVVDLKVDPYS